MLKPNEEIESLSLPKKVGILTMHYADNFGSVLQAYALQEALKSLGYQPEFINFLTQKERDNHDYGIHPFKRLRTLGFRSGMYKILSSIYSYNNNKKRKKLFDKFRQQYLNVDSKIFVTDDNIRHFAKDYNILLTGSDQVWNPYFILPDGQAYLLNFANKNQKKCSYAASIAVAPLKMETIDFSLISDFDGISIREEKQKNKLIELSKREDIQVHIDPTFLLDKSSWLKISDSPKLKNKYIFIYDLVPSQELITFANKMATKFHLDIVSFSNRNGFKNNVLWLQNCSPSSFLGLLNNAAYSISSSFHGVALSIIFEKNFIAFPHPTRGSRITGLLKLTNFENRLIYNADDFDDFDFSDIDYSPVKSIIEKEKEKAFSYLKSFGKN